MVWSTNDSLSACPAGDFVYAGHPQRLKISAFYFDANNCTKVGVPP